MWFVKDFVLMVAAVIMLIAAPINLYGLLSDWSDLQERVYQEYGLTWQQLLMLVTTLAFFAVVGKLIFRVNRYESTARLRQAKRLFDEYAAAALALAQTDSPTTEAVTKLLNEAATKVTELCGLYQAAVFREMVSNSLNPAVAVAGDRNKEALRAAAGRLNSYSNSMTTLQIMDSQL